MLFINMSSNASIGLLLFKKIDVRLFVVEFNNGWDDVLDAVVVDDCVFVFAFVFELLLVFEPVFVFEFMLVFDNGVVLILGIFKSCIWVENKNGMVVDDDDVVVVDGIDVVLVVVLVNCVALLFLVVVLVNGVDEAVGVVGEVDVCEYLLINGIVGGGTI